jgi:tape measure domain-containing protein
MAFLGDLIVRIGANANPFTTALKKAQSMTQTFRSTLKDMEKTASTFAKIAASIKAVNNQMDRLIHVSRRALDSTQNLAKAEHLQAMNRMRELKMLQSMQEKQAAPRRTSMLDIAGGIGIAAGVQAGVSTIASMAKEAINLAAYAETAQITFEVLTGDAAKGAKLFKDIEKFAARTSFDLMSAADATKSLLAAGVTDSDVMNTMQLLGDLAMGDANKLGFLSKAYTDVMNKGKLQGQEIRQFAENGVGLVGALAASMGKTNAEILQMSEDGKISFDDMKKALMGLTGQGGRFHGMMARINETFTGQWNSLVENVQTFGRDLGALVLPKLTEIVAETNKILTAFNSLGDARWKFLGEVLVASFDVGMETIKLHWADMLNSMIDQVTEIPWHKLLNPFGSVNINDLRPTPKPGNLQEAQNRLQGLMQRLQAAGGQQAMTKEGTGNPGFNRGWVEREVPRSAGEAATSLFEKLLGKFSGAKMGAQGIVDRAKIQAGALGGMLENWFGSSDWEKNKQKQQEPQLAGAMTAGSQEAFSTIFAAMLQRGKDPNVQATEKQTRELKKALKENKPQMMLAMGAVGP